MTAHVTLNTVIHAAFRRDFVRMEKALAAFPAGSRERAAQLGTAWANVSFQLHHHHSDEETIFWPALRELGADESLMGELGGEHEGMLTALAAADTAVAALRADPSATSAATAREAVVALADEVEEHLQHEEGELEAFAAANKKTPPMKRAAGQVRKAHKGNSGTFFTWLQDGADADARAFIRTEIPPPVVFLITKLGGREYRKTIAPVWTT